MSHVPDELRTEAPFLTCTSHIRQREESALSSLQTQETRNTSRKSSRRKYCHRQEVAHLQHPLGNTPNQPQPAAATVTTLLTPTTAPPSALRLPL